MLETAESVKQARLLERNLNVTESAQYLGVSASYLNKLRSIGGGPEYIRLGSRIVYKPSDLDSWQEQHRRTSTSDTGDRG